MWLRTFGLLLGLTLLGVPTWSSVADAAPRCRAGKRPEVFIRPKTPIRRGPGLNYQVSRFLERGRCLPFSEVSMDQNWVLIDHAAALGWVPVSRLSKRSQERVAKVQPKPAPVGSAQVRTGARVKQQAMLLEEPEPDAKARRVLVQDLEVVPLAMTDDGRWVQVRDERGDVGWVLMSNLSGDALAGLPVLSDGFNRGVAANEEGLSEESRKVLRAERAPPEEKASEPIVASRAFPSRMGGSERRSGGLDADARSELEPSDGRSSDLIGTPVTESKGLGITAFVLAGALAPTHQLDSNAELGRRRYDLSAFAPAVALQLELTDVGPLAIRAGYLFGLLVGVAPDDADSAGMGQQHQGTLRVGLPLAAGPVLVTPELGYSFGWFDFDSLLPDDPNVFTIVSNQSHMGAAGLRAHMMATRSIMLEGEAAFLLGATIETPRDLGENGLALGVEGGLAAHFLFSDSLALVARYLLRYRQTGFSGPNELDPTLSEATLSELSHGLVLGLSFVL